MSNLEFCHARTRACLQNQKNPGLVSMRGRRSWGNNGILTPPGEGNFTWDVCTSVQWGIVSGASNRPVNLHLANWPHHSILLIYIKL